MYVLAAGIFDLQLIDEIRPLRRSGTSGGNVKNFGKSAVLCAVLALSASSAFATSLAAGGTVAPSAIDTSGFTALAVTSSSITTPTFHASYATAVYSDTNNVYCAGCLDFLYVFTNNGPDVIERATMANFDSFLTNVGYNAAVGTATPTSVTRNSFGDLAFNFSGVASGQESNFLIIETNATNFTSGVFSLQDGTAGSGSAYQPTVTPEPSSLMLMGTGLMSAAGMVIRRRRSIA
jgi:hypothetical protein